MATSTAHAWPEPASEQDDAGHRPPRGPLPPEVSATVLAVSAVLLGGILTLPVYGVFLGWAAASFARHGRIRPAVLMRCLCTGGAFGAATLAGAARLSQLLSAEVPAWSGAVIAFAIANPVLILLGRSRAFGGVPAMFIGFSTVFAVHLGSTHALTDGIVGALLVALVTNIAGVGADWVGHRTSGRAPARTLPGRRSA
jgi:hypothetical protein